MLTVAFGFGASSRRRGRIWARVAGRGPARGCQLLDPLLVTLLADGGLGFQQRRGVLQPGQTARPGQPAPAELVATGGTVLLVSTRSASAA